MISTSEAGMSLHLVEAERRLEFVLKIYRAITAQNLEVGSGGCMTSWKFLAHELASFKYPKGVRCFPRQHRDPLDEPLPDGGKEIDNVG